MQDGIPVVEQRCIEVVFSSKHTRRMKCWRVTAAGAVSKTQRFKHLLYRALGHLTAISQTKNKNQFVHAYIFARELLVLARGNMPGLTTELKDCKTQFLL